MQINVSNSDKPETVGTEVEADAEILWMWDALRELNATYREDDDECFMEKIWALENRIAELHPVTLQGIAVQLSILQGYVCDTCGDQFVARLVYSAHESLEKLLPAENDKTIIGQAREVR